MVAFRTSTPLDSRTSAFYRHSLELLEQGGVAHVVGGAFALAHYTGIMRYTKDFDLFVTPADARRALAVLAEAGYQTELTYPHWLGKAFDEDAFVDVIFSSGNGITVVDTQWFEHATGGEVLGSSVRFCPPEEMIWSKAFVMERERYDGADVAHLLYACAERLDWPRLLRRFDRHWHVLLSHLILFRFVYPGEQTRIPAGVFHALIERLQADGDGVLSLERLCQGPLISAGQYLVDVEQLGFRDARLIPRGRLTADDTDWWRKAIQQGG